MAKNIGRKGGFAAQNNGSIVECYSIARIKAKGDISGGFVAENTGKIKNSFVHAFSKKLTGGFVGDDLGDVKTNCYFFHNEDEDSKELENLRDKELGCRLKEITEEEDAARLGFDIKKIWKYMGKRASLRFDDEKWYYQLAIEEEKEPVMIEDADQLWEFAEKVNQGDEEFRKAYVKLANDINLGGKSWIPIGKEKSCAFQGIFDGAGFMIRNFTVKDKKLENKGFFGVLQGQVYNLTVDCYIKGGSYGGGITAQNEGTIGCCGSVIQIKGRNGNFGGLVGRNMGEIFESYAAGRIFPLLIIPLWFGAPAAVLVGGSVWLTVYQPDLSGIPVFDRVPYDSDAVPMEEEPLERVTDTNFVSFQFQQEIDVDLNTGLCDFQFKNPGNSNHNIIVQLQFSDAQAERIMGSTGRSQREQERMESLPEYDPEVNRMVLAESGLIRPGYELDQLRLVNQADGAVVPPGKYNAVVYLIFYDIETNNRAMLESQLPVVISVHN